MMAREKSITRSKKTVKKVAKKTAKKKLPASERKKFRNILLGLRERVSGQIAALKDDSLKRYDTVNLEEDGTDAFERQLALNLASSGNESLFEIDEALRRIDEGTYGICEECNKLIEKPRLKALPFVRMCIHCQSEIEKVKHGFPFRVRSG